MARLEFCVEIAAPLDRVAAFFVPQRLPYWYGTDIQAEIEMQSGASEFQAGCKVRISGRMAGREVSLTATVTRFELGHLLEWQFRDPYGILGMQRWQLAATATGTRVTMQDEYKLPGRFGWIADALLTRHAVTRRDRLYLANLKRIAEGAWQNH